MATLSLSFTIADDKVAGIKDDFAEYHGWTPTIPDPENEGQTIPNPESQNAFIKRRIGQFIKDSVKNKRTGNVIDEALQTTLANVEAGVILN